MSIDLFKRIPLLKKLVKMRVYQFLLVFPNLIFFYFFLIAGVFGSPVGNRNILIIFVWILWWFALITFMVPFASRIFCSACPFPFFGEWFQRRRLIGVATGKPGVGKNRMWGLKKRWPKVLSNIWFQNILFLCMGTFNALLVTRPIVTVIVLGGLVALATIIHMIFRQRAFCMYICPVSGFLSLYSMTGMLAMRSNDKEKCKACKSKSCIVGSERGWGCPWFQHMQKMDRNNYCGFCMECVKSCPNDNIGMHVQPFAKDTKLKGYDEVWKGFIMLTLAIVYSIVLLGPHGTAKDWANISEVGNWRGFFLYAGIVWFAALIVMPFIYYCTIMLGRKWAHSKVAVKELFIRYGFTLVPMGLFAWIAFSFPLIMVNGSYILSIISDPMGWGWDIFGTAEFHWTPFFPEYGQYIQIGLLALGLFYSLKKGYEIALKLHDDPDVAFKSFLPLAGLLLVITIVFIKLYAG